MDSIRYQWADEKGAQQLKLVHVPGTHDAPFLFGEPPESIAVAVPDFFIGTVPVTQAFWRHVMADESPALHRGSDLPVENISWDALTGADGFLERVNHSAVAATLHKQCDHSFTLRLPTETEWEYAARGGPQWRDKHAYSGSDDISAVAWYDRRHGDWTQPVGQKAPNYLGIYDMSGNIWEWCADTFTTNLSAIPRDGSAHAGIGDERVLRGGCFHNWAMHCTVSKRYEIGRHFHDGCIGFRLVLARSPARAGGV